MAVSRLWVLLFVPAIINAASIKVENPGLEPETKRAVPALDDEIELRDARMVTDEDPDVLQNDEDEDEALDLAIRNLLDEYAQHDRETRDVKEWVNKIKSAWASLKKKGKNIKDNAIALGKKYGKMLKEVLGKGKGAIEQVSKALDDIMAKRATRSIASNDADKREALEDFEDGEEESAEEALNLALQSLASDDLARDKRLSLEDAKEWVKKIVGKVTSAAKKGWEKTKDGVKKITEQIKTKLG